MKLFAFLFLLIFNFCYAMENALVKKEEETISRYPVPEKWATISEFEPKKLRKYIKFYNSEKKAGRVYCMAVLKESVKDERSLKFPKIDMLVFWYVHELLALERRRRKDISIMGASLGELLRNPSLIPEKHRSKITWPPARYKDIQYLKCDSPYIPFSTKVSEDIEEGYLGDDELIDPWWRKWTRCCLP